TPAPTLFPYTTLFRSTFREWERPQKRRVTKQIVCKKFKEVGIVDLDEVTTRILQKRAVISEARSVLVGISGIDGSGKGYVARQRSEEHTSELQSLRHL